MEQKIEKDSLEEHFMKIKILRVIINGKIDSFMKMEKGIIFKLVN